MKAGRPSDAKARAACFARAGRRCEACDYPLPLLDAEAGAILGPRGSLAICRGRLEWAHIVTRGRRSLRREPLNGLCLCSAHHLFFTNHPAAFEAWVEATFPGRLAQLRAISADFKRCNYFPKEGT